MASSVANNNLLIIGLPHSGKTTFLAQLYGRIQAKKSRIILTRAPQNILGIKNAYERLADGLETAATPATDNLEVVVPVKIGGQELELVFKDYGGEQVRDITALLEYDKNWQQRARENDRWLLFIRPGEIYHHYDLSISGYAKIDKDKSSSAVHNELSHQYHFVELIQALLHAKETGIKSEIQTPKLMVVLTCWDELNTTNTPMQVFEKKMPMFYHFLETLWAEGNFTVVGVSPQEFRLDSDAARDKYLDELPESFGYMVNADGTKDRDLTKIIELALQL